MKCSICNKYGPATSFKPIAELEGITLSHIQPVDGGSVMRGRLIIEPKRHVVNPEDLTAHEFSNMGLLLQQAMVTLKKSLHAEHVYFFRINDLVAHFHFHVVPRYPLTPKEFWGLKITDWPEYPQINSLEVESLSKILHEQWVT